MPFNPIAPESTPLSCSEVAELLCISTSTVKRMCDDGVLKTHRTRGGHRRIDPVAVKELRRTKSLASEPSAGSTSRIEKEVLGALDDGSYDADQRIAWLFHDAQAYARALCGSLRLGKQGLTHLLDSEIVPILTRVGVLWSRGEMAVFEEHLITNKVFEVIVALKTLVAEQQKLDAEIARVKETQPSVAIGGTQAYESHGVASAMIEVVFNSCGWEARNLGVLLPDSDLIAAVRSFKPAMVWLSYTVLSNVERAITENNQLYEIMQQQGTKLVVGGQAITDAIRSQMRFDFVASSMADLESYIRTTGP